MFRLFKNKKPDDQTKDDANLETPLDTNEINIKDNLGSAEDQPVAEEQAKDEDQELQQEPIKKEGLFQRLRSGLAKQDLALLKGMSALVLGKKKIDEDVLEELETRLLMADVGMEATQTHHQRSHSTKFTQ